jgi:hypothetical protein
VTSYTNTKIPFISSEKNGPDPLPIVGSSSRWRPRSQAKTVGSRQAGWDPAVPRPDGRDPVVPGQNGRILAGWTGSGRSPNRTAGSRSVGRDLAGMDGILPFPRQNGRIPPGWTESGRSRPERSDPGRLAGMAGIWPFPDQIGRGLGRRGEWSEIFSDMLCFWRGIFTDRWKGQFCLYVLKYFLIHFTIKLMWSHL